MNELQVGPCTVAYHDSGVAAEFDGMRRLATALSDYEHLDAPTTLVVGGRTRRPARAVVEVLASTLPKARVHVLPT